MKSSFIDAECPFSDVEPPFKDVEPPFSVDERRFYLAVKTILFDINNKKYWECLEFPSKSLTFVPS